MNDNWVYWLSGFGIAVGILFWYFQSTDLAAVSLGGGVLWNFEQFNTIYLNIIGVIIGSLGIYMTLHAPRRLQTYSLTASASSAMLGVTSLVVTSPFV